MTMNKRIGLAKINKARTRFAGTFERYGKKTGWKGREEKTVLLKNIIATDSGESVTDHLWFNLTKGFEALGELQPGDVIEFEARVTTYKKGYWGYNEERRCENPPRTDYKLERPTRITKKDRQTEQAKWNLT